MYPTVGNFPALNLGNESGGQGRGGYGHPSPPPSAWPPSQAGSTPNGPQPPPPAASNLPLLRVQIAEHLRTSPPVMLAAAPEDIPRSQFSHSFDYEHQLVRRLQSGEQASEQSRPDPLEGVVGRMSGLGYTREEVAMALTAAGPGNHSDEEVASYCKSYKELRSMGFDSATVTGALVLHKTDVAAATEACLAS